MPTSAPGSSAVPARAGNRARGFTLIELMVVVALIALASAVVTLSIRDPAANRLDQEGARLAAVLESARAQARSAGLPASWRTREDEAGVQSFEFVGLPTPNDLPTHWLGAGVHAEVSGAGAVVLGPEPMIGAQRIVLHLDDQSLALSTDGLSPFAIDATPAASATP